MPKNGEYWQKRFELLEESLFNIGAEYFEELSRQYAQASAAVQADIEKWYARFADNNNITMQEARKLLTSDELEELKWNVMEYIKHGRENDVTEQWMKQLENASAKWHISRLEALKLQMQHHAEVVYGRENEDFKKVMAQIYEEGYYHTAYEIQKGFNLGYSLMKLDTDKIEKILAKPWAADGSNFSDRIWRQKTQLVSELHNGLTQAIIRGQNPYTVTKEIAKRFNVSKGQAGRLVMTEAAFFSSVSTHDCYKELDVERYEILATLDKKTSDICRELDGKVFPMSQYEVGVTAPPFHVWCRTTTVPYFDDEFELGSERAARGDDGKTYYVSADMKYKDWYKKYVENPSESVKVKLGTGSNSKSGNTTRIELGQINVNNTDALMENFSEQIRNFDVENAIVVDKNGNVIQFISTSGDSVEIFDVDLDGASVLHNHPESNGILSFGEDDFVFLREHQNVKTFKCCNTEYDYSVTVLKDISELAYSPLYREAMISADYPLGEDLQHIVFDILRKRGYVNYERKRASGN